jgi:hypothetical protein
MRFHFPLEVAGVGKRGILDAPALFHFLILLTVPTAKTGAVRHGIKMHINPAT